MSQSIQVFANRWRVKLTALLGLQLLLLAFLWWNQQATTQPPAGRPLLSVDSKSVDKLVIETNPSTTDASSQVILLKQKDHWLLPELNKLPADEFKAEDLIGQLKRQKTSWPVSTTEGAQQRFEVAKDKFKKHIVAYSGDQVVADIYIGTSPGYKQSHVRRADEVEVYAVELNNYSILADNKSWLDKGLIQAKSPTEISGSDFVLVKKDDKWQWKDEPLVDTDKPKTHLALDSSKVDQLMNKLAMVNVLDVADKPLQKADFSLKVTNEDKALNYDFAKLDNSYLVKRSDRETTFKIGQMDFEYFSHLKQSEFVKDNKTESVAGQTEKSNEAANKDEAGTATTLDKTAKSETAQTDKSKVDANTDAESQ